MKFSVIIPAHNEEKTIQKALESIRSQTFTNYELIVVCDSCTDKTKDIVEQYNAIVIEIDAHSSGIARNVGLDIAQGEWILFMDDDDWWLHEYVLELIDEKLRYHNNAMDVLCFSFIFKGYKYARPNGNRGHHWAAVWNKCWKRSVIGDTRFPNIHSCSDLYFHQDMFAKHLTIIDWDMPIYYYNYLRPGSISWQDKNGGTTT